MLRPIKSAQEVCVDELKKVLEQLQNATMPGFCGKEYMADLEAAHKKAEAIRELKRKAEVIALLTIPDEVKAVFSQIEDRYYKLLYPGQKEETRDDTEH